MLVVWEPILPTDWRAPRGSTLSRLSDQRVRQFWDPDHEVSKALTQMANLRSVPNSSLGTRNGFHWDEAIVYAPHSKWEDSPVPSFRRGPVYPAISGLATELSEITGQTP